MNSNATGPMSGVRVIDLGAMVTGPMATTILSDQGADVIKIEPPGIGDVMRYFGSSRNGVSGLYHTTNRGKRSLSLNLKAKAAVDVVHKLVATADVVAHNFRPGVAERLGIDYKSLKKHNPELIYLSVCGFGDSGPLSHKAAYDNVIQAFAGVAQSQADLKTGEPIQYYQLFTDKLTALTGSQAISAALFARERGCGGQHIRLSMVDSVVNFLWADTAGINAFLDPGADEGMNPSKGLRLIKFKDGYGAIAGVTDSQFRGYCRAFDEDADNPLFASAAERNSNAPALKEMTKRVSEKALQMTLAEAMAALEANDVPCAIAQDLADLPNHPQMQVNNAFAHLDHPIAGKMIEPNNPANFDGTPSPPLRVCASLGQHTQEILAELGVTDADQNGLREAGIIG
ncbi:MAG: CaiB/BaiF CoA-transferase family protein [Pseudomonadota bacterium]